MDLPAPEFLFGPIDWILLLLMLVLSAGIGVYFGYFKMKLNTTDEYLLGERKMKPIPIAISLIASQLSGITIMSFPAEIYAYGSAYALILPDIFIVTLLMCYIYIPVFYKHNLSNCYQYLEMRFDKKTRQCVTISFLTTVYLILPVIIFVPSLAFSQVTGINIHLINGIVSAVCVFYTMLGGIKAVVWTDVVQAGIMLGSCILVAIFGVYKVGGVGIVLERAANGGRLNIFNMNLDLTTRVTFWNSLIGGIFLWSGYVGLNQSCVQRIVALPSISRARKSLGFFAIGFFIIMTLNCFTGLVMYARYYECDPVKAGVVQKADKMMPFFVQDVVGGLKGMPGVFISCVFSAALSTVSANLNSLSGIVYFDYIRPFIHHTEARANSIMKMLVIISGIYCVVGGIVVEKFTSILQMVITISGITQGAVVGVFTLGMLYPKAHSRAALIATLFSMITVAWIVIGAQIAIRNGEIKYDPLPSSIEECEIYNITVSKSVKSQFLATLNSTIAASTNEESFSMYKISYNWYAIIGAFLVWIVGVPLSHLMNSHEDEYKKFKVDLISPVARFLIPKELRHIEVPQNDFAKNFELKELEKT